MSNDIDYNKKHPKFFTALFGAFFKMFFWIKAKKRFDKLMRKTIHDDKIPTDARLDGAIDYLSSLMEYVWPLINFIVKEKIMNFFRYKFKRFCFKVTILFVFFAMGVGIYKLVNLYNEKPKVVYVEMPKDTINGMVINTDIIFIPAERSIFNKDNLDYFASEMGIKYWYYVRNQIVVETGFTSESCTKAYNLFGMKLPGQRETTAIGEMFGHARFKHWVYSLYDYKLWQDIKLKNYPIKKGENYLDWLTRIGYAEATGYKQAVNSIDWYSFKSNDMNGFPDKKTKSGTEIDSISLSNDFVNK